MKFPEGQSIFGEKMENLKKPTFVWIFGPFLWGINILCVLIAFPYRQKTL